MKKTIAAFAAVLLCLTLASGTMATDEHAAEKAREMALQLCQQRQMQAGMEIQKGQFQGAARILGANVQSRDGENLGEVTNLLFDPQTGQIRYLTVSTSGIPGLGDEQYAVPWQAVTSTPQTKALTLSMTAEQFRRAPKGTNLGSREQEEEIFNFYGVAPYWKEAEQQRGLEGGAGEQATW